MALKLDKLKNISKNPWSFILSDENNPYKINNMTDTGCYILNALLCKGDIFGGLPDGKKIIFSGESSTAKSYFINFIIKSYLDAYKDSVCVLTETEGSSIAETAEEIEMDADRVIMEPECIVEEVHKTYLQYLTELEVDYLKTRKYTKLIFALDSIGMLNSNKEIDDKKAGKNTKDMTRAQAIKSLFRAISLKASLLQTPFIFSNHTYTNIGGYGDSQVAGGGNGAQYAPDVHLYLRKSQRRVGSNQTGVNIKIKIKKSRWLRENMKAEIALDFERGMIKCSYLPQLAIKFGMAGWKTEDKIVTYQGKDYALGYMEDNFEEIFGMDNIKILGEKIKDVFSFGESELNIDFLSVMELASYGVELGLLAETSQQFILPDGSKIKKKALREDETLISEDILEPIREKLRIVENEKNQKKKKVVKGKKKK